MSETRSEATAIVDAAAADADSASTGQDAVQETPGPTDAASPSGDGDEAPTRSEDSATDLSGLEPIEPIDAPVEPIGGTHDGGSPPAITRWRRPRRGTARSASGRSTRLVVPMPAITALVVLVVLAGVTVPVALRATHRNAFLTSSETGVTDDGVTVGASPGQAANAAGGSPVSVVPLSEDAAGGPAAVPGQGSAQPGQDQSGAGTGAGGHSTSPSGGGTRQTGGPGTQQSGNGGGSGVGADPQSDANVPAPQVPGAPGIEARPVSGGVEVTITAPAGGGAATNYVVTAAPGGTASLSAPGTVTIRVDGCARTTVSARADNAAGTSAAASRTLDACVAPSVPRDVTLIKQPPQASDPTGHNLVTWTSPAETGGTGVAVDYIVRVYISKENVVSVSSYAVTGTSYLRSNASGRDPYVKITVAARNPAGQSAEVVVYRGSGPTDDTPVTPLTPNPSEV
ncbi:hypothetical protein [Pseudofrankia asymbiotica]|uniref:Uncharacterized protein n=1 Tax=Pseudofrankia asymbiotica TaxID=1834516 RepID=A0A1V2I5U0_9ACTN|nr:hypothetical protein [Pseudofrankia asymbiotica]ONH25096.1 hypothetical protein BL253_28320 [Pseudofrankia asymbiotica]